MGTDTDRQKRYEAAIRRLGPMGTDTDRQKRYEAAIRRLGICLRDALARGMRPRFRFPPGEIMVVAALDRAAELVSANKDARALIGALMAAADGDATVFMLHVALDVERIEYDTVGLAEFGISVASS